MRDGFFDNSLLYGRQFLAGPRPACGFESWAVKKFGFLFVSHHPSLMVTSASLNDRKVLCLGHIFNPSNPSHNNQEVLADLLTRTRTFKDFEVAIAELAGRWILFATVNGQFRMYPDAGGTKSAFFTVDLPQSELWIGSHPMLIGDQLGLAVNYEVMEEFYRHKVQNSWVGEITPYDDIVQLLPNHYLDLETGQSVRFYASSTCPHYDFDTAVNKIGQILHGTLTAVFARRPVAMPLTGGYDSRALVACAGDLRKKFQFFHISDAAEPFHEIPIAKKVSRKLDIPFAVMHQKRFTKEFREILRANIGDMWWEYGINKIYTFSEFDHQWFVAMGNMAELIRRCSYYRNGIPPLDISPELLAQKSGYAGNPVAIKAFSKWKACAPMDSNIHVLDFFYWEHRIGNWLAMVFNGLDTVCEAIPIYNNRKLFEVGFAVDNKYRTEPSYELFREISYRYAPETVGVPFNTCLRSQIASMVKVFLPSRVKSKWRWGRMKMAGFDIYETAKPADSLLRRKAIIEKISVIQ